MIPYTRYNAILTVALLAAVGASMLTGYWQIAAAALALDLTVRAAVWTLDRLSRWLVGSPLVSKGGPVALDDERVGG